MPNHSMKSIKFIYPPPIYTITHIEKLFRNKLFSLWSNNSSLSKNLLFLSFQSVQKMQVGATLQALMCLFSIKVTFHPRRVSLTVLEITHQTPKMENTNYHNNLTLTQWRRIWSMVSNSTLQKAHLLTNVHPLLWSWSKVKTFPQQASQVKKLTFEGIQEFHTIF